ncbi:hypothetical protein SARC_02841 [Sphaeroforma arctica JP610]|uniref:BHLH domain-containing protein n=1 Tax=Sphaeroforma arctica JP610 TaxID=667725 RepID=A0A0L0G7H1_9EUKA|nr:hypothetical protein SARC_02841 [Sphaeroforma arctica JP610]KNC84950.1 hypothetical protein SARC_02841 [Sphaeroforma arctica JP610]|eukprot:XP_014158852.1 hypothetical protein SARC_02841 [Sphaeroforma arctica JP610]
MSTTNCIPDTSSICDSGSNNEASSSNPNDHQNSASDENEKSLLLSLGLPDDFFAAIVPNSQVDGSAVPSSAAPGSGIVVGYEPYTLNAMLIDGEPYDWASYHPHIRGVHSYPFMSNLQFRSLLQVTQTNLDNVYHHNDQSHSGVHLTRPTTQSDLLTRTHLAWQQQSEIRSSLGEYSDNGLPPLQPYPGAIPQQVGIYDNRPLQQPVRCMSTPQLYGEVHTAYMHRDVDHVSIEPYISENYSFDTINVLNMLAWDPQNSTRTNSTDPESPPRDVDLCADAMIDLNTALAKHQSYDLPFATSQLSDVSDEAPILPAQTRLQAKKRQRAILPRLPTSSEHEKGARTLSFPMGLQPLVDKSKSTKHRERVTMHLTPDSINTRKFRGTQTGTYMSGRRCEYTVNSRAHKLIDGRSDSVQFNGRPFASPPTFDFVASSHRSLSLRRSTSLSNEPPSNFNLTTASPSPMDTGSPQFVHPAETEYSDDELNANSTALFPAVYFSTHSLNSAQPLTPYPVSFQTQHNKRADDIVDKAMRKKHIHKYSEMSRRERLKQAFRELQQAVPDAVPKGRRNLNRGIVLQGGQQPIDYIKAMHEKKSKLFLDRAAELETNRNLRERHVSFRTDESSVERTQFSSRYILVIVGSLLTAYHGI